MEKDQCQNSQILEFICKWLSPPKIFSNAHTNISCFKYIEWKSTIRCIQNNLSIFFKNAYVRCGIYPNLLTLHSQTDCCLWTILDFGDSPEVTQAANAISQHKIICSQLHHPQPTIMAFSLHSQHNVQEYPLRKLHDFLYSYKCTT